MAPIELLFLSALAITSSALPYYKRPSVTSSTALKWFHGNPEAGSNAPANDYKCYNGDITKYPSLDSWLSFEDLWKVNRPSIASINDDDEYIPTYVKDAILTVAKESNVNSRLILAAIMQESSGKASVRCTHSGEIENCGMMQASYDSKSFDSSNPKESILQMIREGVQGTSTGGPNKEGGPGYAQYLEGLSWVDDAWTGNPYAAARAYNSGRVGKNLDVVEYGVESYANDIANRLLGWDGKGDGFKGCQAPSREGYGQS